MFRILAALVLVLVPALTVAEDVAILLPNVAKSYTVTTDGKGGAVIVPLAGLVRPGDNPTPTPAPVPTLTPFAKEIQAQTANVLTRGGSKTTGAGLSEVYSRVADGIGKGTIPPAEALGAIRAATNLVLNEMPDKAVWEPWRAAVGDALTKLQQEGSLATKEQYAGAFREVAGGLNAATGYQPQVIGEAELNVLSKGTGILGGIDIAKIIELIKLIMELLKLFGGK